jgi:single-strand DNA-binding protein
VPPRAAPLTGVAGQTQEDGMINEAQVFLAGYVAREPRFRITTRGIPSVSLRVACTPRWVDRETGEWTDGETSFVTVLCWRTLADNVAKCLHKGEPVLVKGRLHVRPYEKDGVSRLAVEIEATSVGHDLARGVASFQRPRRPVAENAAPENGAPGNGALGGSGAEAGHPGGPGAEAGPDGTDAAIAALEARNGTDPALAALDRAGLDGAGLDGAGADGVAEAAGVSAPF